MRAHCKLTVLLVTVLVILADAVPVSLNADQRIVSTMDSYNDISSRSLTVENHASAITKRLLRSHTAPHAAEGTVIGEERVINVPGLSKLADAAEKTPSKKKPEHVFNKLRLGENALELEKTPKFFQWAMYTTKYIERRPANRQKLDSYFISNDFYKILLKTTNSEGEVARLVHSLEQVPELSALAKMVQGRQIASWVNRDLSMNDVEVLLGVTESMQKSDPRYVASRGFLKEMTRIRDYKMLDEIVGGVERNNRNTVDAIRDVLRGQ